MCRSPLVVRRSRIGRLAASALGFRRDLVRLTETLHAGLPLLHGVYYSLNQASEELASTAGWCVQASKPAIFETALTWEQPPACGDRELVYGRSDRLVGFCAGGKECRCAVRISRVGSWAGDQPRFRTRFAGDLETVTRHPPRHGDGWASADLLEALLTTASIVPGDAR